ncbi:MAG: hypothetical protein IH934_00135 [Nanoarchaeota archaeon]|nr:hypothetical protein [Nanoarchaeota archaeon]
MTKEVRKIGVLFILSWIVGILFILAGAASLFDNIIGALLIILGGIIILPPFGDFIKKKYNVHLTGWLRFIVFLILISVGASLTQTSGKDVVVKPTEQVQKVEQTPIEEVKTETKVEEIQPKEEPKKQKIKSATLNIDRIQIQLANLYPTRVTVTNTGDTTISPKFDMYVYQGNKEICAGSPTFAFLFESIASKEKKTDEIILMGCIFEENDDYTMRIDLLDSDFNKLDSKTKSFTVNDAILRQQEEMEDLLKQLG